jgi:hypothetical protein
VIFRKGESLLQFLLAFFKLFLEYFFSHGLPLVQLLFFSSDESLVADCRNRT